jgi:ABC-2 type transport system ATP-binding protein
MRRSTLRRYASPRGSIVFTPVSDSEPVIRTRGLTKAYGSRLAVSALDLEVPRGCAFGLLGQNGAGKTTTIRMLLGLVRPSGGEALVFGRRMATERLALLPRIGCLVEGPAFYPYLSGRKNLQFLGDIVGGVPPARVQACLERVGLGDRGEDLFRGYSTGMRQRLGIASALLLDPELVILDEPVSGLDPPAILVVRRLIRDLVEREGKTVVISSHLLNEVEVSCDRVAVLEKGKLLAAGRVDELVKKDEGWVDVTVVPVERATEVARGLEGVRAVEPREGGIAVRLDPARSAALNRRLVEAGLDVTALAPRRRSLEELFHELAGTAAVDARELRA